MGYELAVGLKKGHKVTKLPKKLRPSRKKGVSLVAYQQVASIV